MKQDQKPFIYFGGLILGYFFVIQPIMEKLGIIKSSSELKVDVIESLENEKNPFSPRYLAQFGAKVVTQIKPSYLDKYATQIYDALGNFTGDDENAVYSVFRALKAKTQVSQLAQYFQKKYGKDLFGFLRNAGKYYYGGLNDNEMNIVLNIVDKLKPY